MLPVSDFDGPWKEVLDVYLPNWRPAGFGHERWGCGLHLRAIIERIKTATTIEEVRAVYAPGEE